MSEFQITDTPALESDIAATLATPVTGIPQSTANPLLDVWGQPDYRDDHEKAMDGWRQEGFKGLDAAALDPKGFYGDEKVPHGYTPDEWHKRRLVDDWMHLHTDGQDPPMGLSREFTRARLAERVFGGAGAENDDALYGEITKAATGRKDEKDFQRKLMAAVADDVAMPTGTGKGMAGFLKSAKGHAGYDPGKAADYSEAWAETRAQVAEKMAPYREQLDQVWKARRNGGEVTPETLASIPDEDLPGFLQALRLRAETLGDEEKETFLAGMRKDFARTVEGFGENAMNSAIDAGFGMSATGRPLDDKINRDFAPGEFEAAKAGSEKARNRAYEVNRIMSGSFDPIDYVEGLGWLQKAPGVTVTSLSMAVPVFGPVTMAASMSGAVQESTYLRLRDSGMSEQDAGEVSSALGPVVMVPQIALERIGYGAWGRNLPWLNKIIDGMGDMVANRAARFAIKTGVITGIQGTEEVMQDFTEYLVQDMASAIAPHVPDVDLGKEFAGAWRKFPETAGSMMLLSLFGAAGGLNAEARAQAWAKATPRQMTALGITPEGIQRIEEAQARGPASLLSTVTDEFSTRDPNTAAAAAAAEAEAAELKQKAASQRQAVADLERLGYAAPTFTTTAEGVFVFDSEGNELGMAQNYAGASRIAAAHTTALVNLEQDRVDALTSLMEGVKAAVALDPTSETEVNLGEFDPAQATPGMAARFAAQVALKERAEGGTGNIARSVLGYSVTEMAQGVRHTVNRLFKGASITDAFHETGHGLRRKAHAAGTITRAMEASLLINQDTVYAGRRVRNDQDKPKGTDLRLVPDGITAAMLETGEIPAAMIPAEFAGDGRRYADQILDEGVSEIIEAEVLKLRKGKGRGKLGITRELVQKNLQAMARLNATDAKSWKSFFAAVRGHWGLAMSRAVAMAGAERRGEFDPAERDAYLDKLLGLDQQTEHDAGVRDEFSRMLAGFDDVDIAEDDIPFSIGRATVTPTASTRSFQGAAGSPSVIGPASFSIGAFHGTPHQVDKFTTDKIGTGEGAQAYGWGLYFADSEKVAEEYRNILGSEFRMDGEIFLKSGNFGPAHRRIYDDLGEEAADILVAFIDQGKDRVIDELNNPLNQIDQATFDRASDFLDRIEATNSGNLYRVTLKVDDEELLDWDKPLSEQSEKVRAAFQGWLSEDPEALAAIQNQTGADWYGRWENTARAKNKSEYMLERLGIRGIRYHDGNSRWASAAKPTENWSKPGEFYVNRDGQTVAEGTFAEVQAYIESQRSYNYVVFDEADIEILEENGTPVNLGEGAFSIGRTDRPLFSATNVQDLRHDKTAWLDGDADTAGANDIVSKYYKTAAFAGIPKDALLVAMPSTSGRNILPFALANRISKDFGQAIEQRPVGTATAKGEAKNKRTFFDKEADPVAFVPVAKVIADLQGKRVFITEDVHNTGESWIAFARMLMDNGVQVLGVATLVSTEQRITSPRDIERLSEKIAAATGKGIDEVLPAMHSLFDGTFKQLFNKAEAEVSRSNTRRNAENSAKLFDIASSGRRAGAYSNPLQSGDGSGGEVLGGDGLNQGTFGFSIGSFHESLLDRIGEDELRLEQPKASYEDKRQLLLDFSKSILEGDAGEVAATSEGLAQERDLRGRIGNAAIIRQRLARDLETDLQVRFIGETIGSPEELAVKAQALRNPRFETFYLLATKRRTKRHKGGAGYQILDAMAITARVPCSAAIFADGKNTEDGLADHLAFLQGAKADSYFLMHNHPSGDPSPSSADVRATLIHSAEMKKHGIQMVDHVVINHASFATIDDVGVVNGHAIPPSALREAGAEVNPYAWPSRLIDGVNDIGREAWSPDQIALISRDIESDRGNPDHIIGFITTARGSIAATFTGSAIDILQFTREQISEYTLSQGGAWLMLHAKAASKLEAERMINNFHGMNLANLLTDIVVDYVDEKGRNWYTSGMEMGIFSRTPAFYGLESNIVGERVQETDEFDFKADMKAQGRWLVDEARKMGYANADELNAADPDAFTRLAVQWREDHPRGTGSDSGSLPGSGERGRGRGGEGQGGEVSLSLGPAQVAGILSDNALSRITDPRRRTYVMSRIARDFNAMRLQIERITSLSGIRRSKGDLRREAMAREDLAAEEKIAAIHKRFGSLLADEDLGKIKSQPVHSFLSDPTTPLRGRVMSKRQAIKNHPDVFQLHRAGDYDGSDGVSRSVFGGQRMPDQAAQELFDEGLISEPTADAMWEALLTEQKTVAGMKEMLAKATEQIRAAKAEAKQEANEWLATQGKDQEVNFSDKEEIRRSLRMYDAIMLALPSEARGNLASGYTQISMIASDEAKLAFLKDALAKADKYLESFLRVEYAKEWEELLKKAAPQTNEAGQRPTGSIAADAYDVFRVAEHAMGLGFAEGEAEADKWDAIADHPDTDPKDVDLARVKAQMIRLTMNWPAADAARREQAVLEGDKIYFGGLRALKIENSRRRERLGKLRDSAVRGTGKTGHRMEREAAKQATATKLGAVKAMAWEFLSFGQVVNVLFGEKSDAARWMNSREIAASNGAHDGFQAKANALESLFDTLSGNRFDGEKLRHRMATDPRIKVKDVLGVDHTFTESQAITFLLMYRQEDGKRHLQGLMDDAGNVVSEWAWDDKSAATIEAGLSAEGRAAMAFLGSSYGEEYGRINDVFRRIWNVSMPRHKMYAPLSVKPVQGKGDTIMDPVSGDTMGAGMTPGSLKNRSFSAIAEPDFKDAFQVYLTHARQMEHFIGYAEFSRDALGIINRRETRNAIEAAGGADAAAVLSKWVDYFALGGIHGAAMGGAWTKILGGMLGRLSQAALVGRVSVLCMQSLQLAAASFKMPTGAFLTRFAKLSAGRLQWGDTIQSEYIQRRLQQLPPVVRDMMAGMASGTPNRAKYLAGQMGRSIAGADALFTAGTYAIFYDYHLGLAKKAGIANPEAHAHAEAERLTDQVAQPVRTGARSWLEVANAGNPAFRAAWNYSSDPRQKMSMLVYAAMRRDTSGKEKAGDVAFTAAKLWIVGGVLQTLMRTVLRDLRNDDDDEIFDERYWSPARLALQVGTGPLGAVPFLGGMIENATYAATGQFMPQGGMLSFLEDGFKMFNRWGDGKVAPIKDLETLTTAGAGFFGTSAAAASAMHIIRDVVGFIENLEGPD